MTEAGAGLSSPHHPQHTHNTPTRARTHAQVHPTLTSELSPFSQMIKHPPLPLPRQTSTANWCGRAYVCSSLQATAPWPSLPATTSATSTSQSCWRWWTSRWWVGGRGRACVWLLHEPVGGRRGARLLVSCERAAARHAMQQQCTPSTAHAHAPHCLTPTPPLHTCTCPTLLNSHSPPSHT